MAKKSKLTEGDLLELGINVDAETFDTVVSGFNFVDKAIVRLKVDIEKLNQKLSSTDFTRLNTQLKGLQETLATQTKRDLIKDKDLVKLKEKTRLEEEIAKSKVLKSSLISKNTQKEIANLQLKTKQNNALAKNKKYLQAQVDYAKSLETKNKAVKDAIAEANKETGSWLTKLKKISTIVISAKIFITKLVSLTKQSSSWIENLNLFAVTFGDNYQETLDWALEFSNRLGVSNNEIVRMTGLFKQLSTAIGVADKTGDELSKTLTKLAYDFASFYNIADVQTVTEKLQSGIFSGQVKTLRSLGIDVSQESINTLLENNEALKKLGVSASGLSQTQKVLARVILTMQSGLNAFGDMSRSIETLENRIRVFKGSVENLKLALGDLVSPYFSDFIAYVNGFIQALTVAIRKITPIKKELTYDVGNTIFTKADEDLEEFSNNLGLLSFDKFESLSSGREGENLAITEALTKELEKQQALYEEKASQFAGIDRQVESIKNKILDWIFPERTTEELGKFNGVLTTIYHSLESLYKIIKSIAEPMAEFALNIIDVVNKTVNWLDKLNMLEPTLQAILSLALTATIFTKISKITKALEGLNTPLGKIAIFVGTFSTILSFLNSLDGKSKIIWSLVTAVSALALAVVALNSPLTASVKTLALTASLGVGIASLIALTSSAKGFATGGIPEKSELFYMNEYGRPEALIKTGNSQTNVVNMQQLRQMTKEGFIEAIYETGLNRGAEITLRGSEINDSTLARALFPALKVESKKYGGNQL